MINRSTVQDFEVRSMRSESSSPTRAMRKPKAGSRKDFMGFLWDFMGIQ